MANPLYGILNAAQQMSGPSFNFQQMLQQFQQFKASFQGDPRQEVEKLLQSGRISQAQLNQLQNMASQIQQFMR